VRERPEARLSVTERDVRRSLDVVDGLGARVGAELRELGELGESG
jgi:hypothetical protein